MTLSPRTLAGLSCFLLAATLAPSAMGQQVYRIVGPDGRVTFSDRPPTEGNVKATKSVADGGSSAANASLPFELRQIASRFPVLLYSGPDCAPCTAGRAFLNARGIPFSERTVVSNADIEALQRVSGAATVPLLTIGAQQLKGFSEPEWAQFLDAAGYPKTSQLPPNYRNAPSTPLVAAQAPVEPPARATPQDTAATSTGRAPSRPTPLEPPPSNPAGIRF